MRIHMIQHLRQIILGLALFLLSLSSALAGGEKASIAGISMARTFVASSRGLEAIGTNPANLALGDNDRTVTFTLIPPFGLGFRSDFLDYEIYNDFFTGVDTGGTKRAARYLTAADKERILSVFPSGLAETHFDFDVRIFGLTVHAGNLGSLGLAVTERVASNFELPRDYARFALEGLDTTGTQFDLSGTDARAWWLREYSLSYARMLPDLVFAHNVAVGITLKMIHGYGYVGTDHYNAHFSSRPDPNALAGYRLDADVDFLFRRSGIDAFESSNTSISPIPDPAGTGYGLDIGVSGEVHQGVRAAISVTDIGNISWMKNTKEQFGNAIISMTNPTSKEQQDSLETAFKGNERNAGEFSTPLAMSLHVGASIQVDETQWLPWIPGRLLLSLEYQQGFNKSPGNSTRPRAALGMEYRPIGFLPLRTGISAGGADRFNWAFGFGFDLGAFTFDLGTENFAMLFTPNSFNQFSVGMGMRIKI